MRFGVHLFPYHGFETLDQIVAFVVRAEELGFSHVHIPEHRAIPPADVATVGREWPDPLVLAAYLAARTSRIRLFFGVLVLPLHDPVRLAKELATLDRLAGGRVDVGVGLGSLDAELRACGVERSERAARMQEHVAVMRALWGRDPCAFAGRFTSFPEVCADPKPLQQPHPPVFVGGAVGRSELRAASYGDGWFPMAADLDALERGIARLRRELERRGRAVAGYPIATRLPFMAAGAAVDRHMIAAGSAPGERFDGDATRAREWIARGGELGVTHMWAELPAAAESRLRGLERFAEVLF